MKITGSQMFFLFFFLVSQGLSSFFFGLYSSFSWWAINWFCFFFSFPWLIIWKTFWSLRSGRRKEEIQATTKRKRKITAPPNKKWLWDDMEVPEESFHWSSWDSWTCYPRRAFIQGLTDDCSPEHVGSWIVLLLSCVSGSLDLFFKLAPGKHHEEKEEQHEDTRK